MSTPDPIVEEVREARRKLLAEHGNDLERLVEALNEKERERGRTPVSFEKPDPAQKGTC
jgi:hypothetical protein